MSDPQDDLIDAIENALTAHAEMHGAWVIAYEENALDSDGATTVRASLLGSGSPFAQLGAVTVARQWCLDRATVEEGEW